MSLSQLSLLAATLLLTVSVQADKPAVAPQYEPAPAASDPAPAVDTYGSPAAAPATNTDTYGSPQAPVNGEQWTTPLSTPEIGI